MTIDHRAVAESCRQLHDRRREADGRPASPVELALGIVCHVTTVSDVQARALVACWWPGWDVATLDLLLDAERHETIVAHYRAPEPGRLGYAEAAAALGLSPSGVRRAVKLGSENLFGWLSRRALLSHAR